MIRDHSEIQECEMPETPEEARLWMLEVVSCDEQLGADGMCDCAREHFAQLNALRDRLEAMGRLLLHPSNRGAKHD